MKFKKLFGLIVCAILLSFFSCGSVKAETTRVSTKGIGGYYHAYKNSSGTFSRYGQIQSFYISNGTYKDERVYCIAPGEVYYGSKDYTIIANTDGSVNSVNSTQNKTQNKLTEEQLDMMSYYAYYGYGYGNHNTNIYIVATQMLIYRVIENQVFTNANCANGSCSKINDPADVAAAMAEIQELVDNHFVYPSFNGTEITINVGETKVLADTNGVLQKFQVKTCENCTATVNDNDLVLTATQNGTIKLTMEKRSENYNTDVMFLTSSESQNMLKSGNLDPLRINVTGTAIAGSVELYKTNEDGTINLSNASYNLFDSNHNFIAKLTTNENGYVKYDNLPLGNYTLEEVDAPTGYSIDTRVHSFSITESVATATVRLQDNLIEGYVEIYKLDSENNNTSPQGEAVLTGAKYDIYTENDVFVETLTINESNYAKSSKLQYGKYYLIEREAPTGYKLNESKYNFEIKEDGATVTINAKDDVIKGRIKITKYDNQNNSCESQGDAKLKGAVYEIFDKNNNVVDTLTIGNDCTATSKLLPYGTYKVKEKTASIGYHIDTITYNVTISNETEMSVLSKEKVIKTNFELYKVEADSTSTILNAEPNATFEFYLKSLNELYTLGTTDSNGHLRVTLPYGTYIVKQTTSAPNFEKVRDFEIVAKDENEETITRIISNAELTAKLKLIKKDADSNNTIARAGFKFKIKKLDTNEYICQNITYPTASVVCEYNTDSNGEFITPYALKSGNYQIEEIEEQDLNGYLWNSEPLKFSINQNSNFTYSDEFGIMLEVKFTNKQVKGEFELEKTGEKFVINNGEYSYEEIKLNDISYELYADEDIYSADGTLIYEKGKLIKSFKTVNGSYKEENLYLGKYYLIETETKENHILNNEPIHFELKYKDAYTEIISKEITQKNYMIKSDFELSKVDLSTSEPVEDALIEIYTEDDKLVFSGRTNKDGKIELKDLAIGKYKFKESEAPEGYILNDEMHYFEVKENGTIIKDTIKNKKIVGEFILSKTDLSTGKPVENALIEITTDKGEPVFSGRTDKNGEITIKDLPYGKYKFIESEAPNGYLLNTEPHYFEIKEDGEIIKDTIINEKIFGGFELTKTDFATGEVVKDALIEIYDSENNLIYSGRTNEEGKIFIDKLEYGKYYFKESEAPEGYILNDAIHYFEIKEKGVIVRDTLSNEKEIIEVPKTEKNDIPYIEIISGLLITSGLGFILFKKRKRGMMKNETK